jgi:hypothetical protein
MVMQDMIIITIIIIITVRMKPTSFFTYEIRHNQNKTLLRRFVAIAPTYNACIAWMTSLMPTKVSGVVRQPTHNK